MLWNLFLAIIPVGLAALAARTVRAIHHGRSGWLWLLLAPLLVAWLAFLPNSCYLFTEQRHLLAAVDRYNLWMRARSAAGAYHLRDRALGGLHRQRYLDRRLRRSLGITDEGTPRVGEGRGNV